MICDLQFICDRYMCGQTPEELAAEEAIARQLRPNLKVAVFHATLSVDHTEKLEDRVQATMNFLVVWGKI